MTPPSRLGSPAALLASPRLARPFLHPNVSRLRSFTPQVATSQLPAHETPGTSHSHLFEGASPSPSGFSSISRTSSISNLRSGTGHGSAGASSPDQAEVFRWSELQLVTKELYRKNLPPTKALDVLGAAGFGSPTVLAANGYICVGLTDGRICVYDFKQNLKAVCGVEGKGVSSSDDLLLVNLIPLIASIVGAVTSLALSHDHTCVASGHATGHIQIFDLKKPQNPIRSVPPTTLGIVATGRKEGHLQGSRIINVGFISGRHTALVSADEHGLAFYHSLGKMLFVEASDILRILGQYPDPAAVVVPSSSPAISAMKRKTRYTILAMAPLPLGVLPHPTDAYDVVALLTPTKLVVVGLRPTPKTWFKCPRDVDEGQLSKAHMKGAIAWYPSVPQSQTDLSVPQTNGKKLQPENGLVDMRNPILAYSWGNSLRFITVSEKRFKQKVQNTKTGRTSEIEIGSIVFQESGRWTSEETILAIQWLNSNVRIVLFVTLVLILTVLKQLIVLTGVTMGVYDIQLSKLVEKATYDGSSLISPTLNMTTTASITYGDSVADVAHSLRVYKGKIFLLVRVQEPVHTLSILNHLLRAGSV